jgi:flagellar hook-associated protein 2
MSVLTSVNLNALYSAFGSSSSGIDVSAAVSQIIAAESVPAQQWQAQQQTIGQQKAALNQLNSSASTLMDDLDALQSPTGPLMASYATSTQPSVVTAMAAAGTASGNHIIVVQSLATTASWYSDSVADSNAALAPGDFDLTIGSGGSQTTTTITVGNGVNSPNDLAQYINGLNLGITASVITDAHGARVALVSNTSGSASDFSIAPSGNSGENMFTRAGTGGNASLTVDGVPISSSSNTVTGAISGVTLTLVGQAPDTQVRLSVGPDATRASQAINAFVTAYNSLLSQVNSQFTYDSTNQTSGPLGSDSTLRMFQSELLSAMSYSSSGASISSLRSLGITMNNDGTLAVDSATLSGAIQNNPGAVQAFFQGTSSNGFSNNLKSAVNTFADPTDGAFTVDMQSLTNENTDLQNQINDFQDYLTSEQTRLTAEYNQANILLLQMPTLQKQIDALLGNTGSNS